jgi:hypothetical protein
MTDAAGSHPGTSTLTHRSHRAPDGTDVEPSAPRLAFVCALLLLLIGLLLLLPDTAAARSLSTAITGVGLITALRAARVGPRFANLVSTLVAVIVTFSILATVAFGSQTTTPSLVLLVVLVISVPVAILASLRDTHRVSVQTVFGAISIYLVIGIVFALLMTLTARFSSTPYFAQGTDGSLSQRVYFSYVTLATLGYGDLTPATGAGRLLAVVETIIGNLYLVTAVSLVVSRIGQPRRRDGA